MLGSSLLVCALSAYGNYNKTQNTAEHSNISNSTNIPSFVNTSNSTLTFSSNSTIVASNNVKLTGKGSDKYVVIRYSLAQNIVVMMDKIPN
ncbi:hypothetical protein QUB43_21550, partial [Microcoleus sp. A6-D4]